MKTKLFILLLFLTTSNLFAQGNHKSPDDVVYIPDPNFLYRLLNHANMFGGQYIDTNNNNQIEVSEAEAITTLILGSNVYEDYLITDMTGIEAFVNITSLQCTYNEIGALDLSQNTQLEYLECEYNNITTLNVTQCTNLIVLRFQYNGVNYLDISGNTALEELYCYHNSLTSLIIGNNTNLKELWCGANQLSDISITNCVSLERLSCTYNNLSSLDLHNNINLSFLSCAYNQITYLDISQNILLNILAFKNNMITSIDVSHCTLLERIKGGGNQLTEIDLSLNTKLQLVEFENNLLTNMDIRNTNNTIITDFDATNNPNLTCIFVDDATYSDENWLNIDETSHFVESQEQCDALSIDEVNQVKDLMIVPNPVNNSFIIDTDFDYKGISIYNNIGKLIAKYNKQKRYFLTELTAGFYYIQIESPEGMLTKKIIKR